MNDRWRVKPGTHGAVRVYRGESLICVFNDEHDGWRRAHQYARQEAVYENLSIVSVEVCS